MEPIASGAGPAPGAPDQEAYWPVSKDTGRALASHMLYTPVWQPCELTPQDAAEDVTWVLLCAFGSSLNALGDHLRSMGASVMTVWPGGLAKLGHDSETALLQRPELEGRQLRMVLSSCYFAAPQIIDSFELAKTCHQAARTVAAIAAEQRLTGSWLVTEAAQAVMAADDDVHPAAAALWGLFKTALSEYPNRFGGLVDVPARQERGDSVTALARLFRTSTHEQVLAMRLGRFYREHLQSMDVPRNAVLQEDGRSAVDVPESQHELDDPQSMGVLEMPVLEMPAAPPRKRFQPRANAAYLITGAFGSVGFILARHLLEGDAGGLVLQARRPPSPEQLRRIETWRAQGARISVLIDALSTGDAETKLAATLTAMGLPLGGIFHLAATRADAPLAMLDHESWAAPFVAKHDSLPLLRRLAREAQVDAFVYFCSLATVLGSPGQANRVAANAVLEALAREDRRAGVPAICILWGPWAEASPEASHDKQRQRRLLRNGLKHMDARSVMAMFDAAVVADRAVCIAAEVDWLQLARSAPHLSWLEEVGGDTRASDVATSMPIRSKLPAAVFLLSAPRSGSTLLRAMLAGHSRLFAPPELHLLQFDTMRQRSVALSASGLDEGLIRAYMELAGVTADTAREQIQQWVEDDLLIAQAYATLQRLAGQRLLVDKSPSYAMNADALADIERWFDGAKYIHLTRDPHGMIESYQRMRMYRMFGDGTDAAQASGEFVWSTCNRNLLKLQAAIPATRWYTVSYEHLVQAPQRVMPELCEFLEIPFEPSVLTPHAPRRMTDGFKPGGLPVGDPNFSRRHGIVAALAEVDPAWRVNHPLGPATQTVAGKLGYTKALTQSVPWMSGCREIAMDVGGRRLSICQWGSPAGTPILILHGWQDQGATWAAVARNLSEAGYRVFAPDLRQHGRDRDFISHRPSTFDFLVDTHALLQAQRLTGVHIIGHAFGSLIAALLAAANPAHIASLSLVEPMLPEDTHPFAADALRRNLSELAKPQQMIRHDSLQAVARRLQYGYPNLPADALQALALRIAEPDGGGYVCPTLERGSVRLVAALRDIDSARLTELFSTVDVPVLWLQGARSAQRCERDDEELRNMIPTAQILAIEGGHNLHIDAPNVVSAVLADFFRQNRHAAATTAVTT
jgi:pimeloyl-ACP methyl ester carboxylesterase